MLWSRNFNPKNVKLNKLLKEHSIRVRANEQDRIFSLHVRWAWAYIFSVSQHTIGLAFSFAFEFCTSQCIALPNNTIPDHLLSITFVVCLIANWPNATNPSFG